MYLSNAGSRTLKGNNKAQSFTLQHTCWTKKSSISSVHKTTGDINNLK